jgi:hypothetical protein
LKKRLSPSWQAAERPAVQPAEYELVINLPPKRSLAIRKRF